MLRKLMTPELKARWREHAAQLFQKQPPPAPPAPTVKQLAQKLAPRAVKRAA